MSLANPSIVKTNIFGNKPDPWENGNWKHKRDSIREHSPPVHILDKINVHTFDSSAV